MSAVERRGKGTYSIVYELPPAADGSRRQKRETIRGKKSDALDLLAKRRLEVRGGAYVETGKLTLAEYLRAWIEIKGANHSIADSVYTTYRQRIEDYLIPSLGRLKIEKLTAAHVKQALGVWSTMPRKDRKSGPRSSSTVRHVYDLLRAALNDAVDEHRVTANPCKDVKPPVKLDADISHVDSDDAPKLVAGLADSLEVQLAAVMKLSLGVRRSELCALSWRDCGEKPGFAIIRRRILKLRDGTFASFSGLKNKRKKGREVPMPASLQSLLAAHKTAQQVGFEAFGLTWNEDVAVLARADGIALTPDELSSAFSYRVRSRKLPKVSLHGLRHSYVSIGGEADIPLEVRSDLVGHSSIKITHDVYDRVHDRVKIAAAAQLDELLRGTIEIARRDTADP